MNAVATHAALTATTTHTSTSDNGVDLFYQPSESIFAAAAPDMVGMGWSVFPQEVDRRPGRVFGATIKWSEDHDLKHRLPSADTLDLWCNHCATLNVAAVFGPASGNTFALDIDVLDEAGSNAIEWLAGDMLGFTPLLRVGMKPKVAMIYRHSAEEAEAFRSARIGLEFPEAATETGRKGELEIQGAGKLLTFHGRHHKTGNYFTWPDMNPQSVGPETAPLVTAERFAEFLAAVRSQYGSEAERGKSGAGRGAPDAVYDVSAIGDLRTAKLTLADGKKRTDGREEALRDLVLSVARLNADAIKQADAEGRLDAVRDKLAEMACVAWLAGCEMSGKWTHDHLRQQASEKMRRATGGVLAGRIKPDNRPAIEARLATERAELAASVERDRARSEAEHVEKKAQREAQPPFSVLGHDRGRYYILCRSGQVRDFSARELAMEGTLLEIDSIDFWFENYCGAKGGINTKSAANHLIEQALEVGIYNPDRLRGRGVHLDGGQVVAHLGDKLIVDGKTMSPRAFKGKFMYELAQPLSVDVSQAPATTAEAQKLIEVCEALPLQPGYGSLLAGWLVTASVCGAMPWRPHGWLTGEKGSGKSWTLDNIVLPLLGPLALAAQSKTTEAGLRGKLGTDARPVIFDEAETQNVRDRDRIQQVLDLARQASAESGPDIIKGSADGGARVFRIRSCFLFSSINLGMTQAADESRTIVYDFSPSGSASEREASFKRLQAHHAACMTPGFGARLFSRTLSLLPVIRQNAEVLAQALARSGRTRRLGDTLGVPLAGLWSLGSDTALTPEQADRWLEATPWVQKAAVRTEAAPEWRRALDYMLQTVSKVVNNNGLTDNRQIGELIEAAAGAGQWLSKSDDAAVALSQWGIRVDGRGLDATVLIANTSRGLTEAFAQSDWGASWATTIARAPGASKPGNPIRFNAALKCRATEIPYRVMASED